MHYEAIKYEKERNAGFLSPFGYSAASVAAAADAVCSMEVIAALYWYLPKYKCSADYSPEWFCSL